MLQEWDTAVGVWETRLEGGFGKRGGVVVGDHIAGGFAVVAEKVEVVLVSQVALIALGVPAGDVHFGDGVRERRVGGGLEFFDDEAVREAVIEHVVDLVAENFWELGDFAVAAVWVFRSGRRIGRGRDDGEFRGWRGSLALRLHR